MIQSVLLRYQSQTIPSILDYKHLTHVTLKNIQSVKGEGGGGTFPVA